MSSAYTHFCDYCGKEMWVWGENVITYHGHKFCSYDCANVYIIETKGL